MKRGRYIFSLITVLLLIVLLSGVLAVDDLMSLQGNVKQAGLDLSLGNLTTVIYDAQTGGNLIYNSSNEFNGAIVAGKYDVMLGNSSSNNLSLEYGKFYYLEIFVNNEKFSFNNSGARQIFQSSTGQVNGTYINSRQINQTHFVYSIDLSNATGYNSSFLTGQVSISQLTLGSNIVLNNQSSSFSDDQNITLGARGWFKGLFNWIVTGNSSHYLSFNGSTLVFDEARLNATIDNRVVLGGANSSWNQTYADSKYANIIYSYNQSLNPILSNIFNQDLNTTNNVLFSDLNVTNVLRVGSTVLQADTSGTLNVTGVANFNGGWRSQGVTISGGNVFAQTLFVYNITSLAVNDLEINGSIVPDLNNTFDIGNITQVYKNIYLSGDQGNIYFGTNSVKQWLYNASQTIYYYNQTPNLYYYNATPSIYYYNQTASPYFYNQSDVPNTVNAWKYTATTLYNDTSGVNVSIGTSAPKNKLTISTDYAENIPALGSAGGRLGLLRSGAYGLILGTTDTGLSWLQSQRVDGTATAYNLALQPNGGNIGIGVITPSNKLTVNGTFNVTGGVDTQQGLLVGSSGRVGINQNIPTERLEVNGNIYMKGYSIFRTDTGNAYGRIKGMYAMTGVDDALYISTNFNRTSGTAGSFENVLLGTTEVELRSVNAQSALNPAKSGIILFKTGMNGTIPTIKITIDENMVNITNNFVVDNNLLFVNSSSDSVGIGTTTPSEKLTVAGNVTTINSGNLSATYFFGDGSKLTNLPNGISYWQTNGTAVYNATVSQVGIGTATPTELLDVNGHIIIPNAKDLRSKNTAGSKVGVIGLDSGNQVGIYDDKVNIDSTGKVGIGVIAPTALLHVNSSSGLGALFIQNTSDYPLLFVNGSNGRVGIGTTTPTSQLELVSTDPHITLDGGVIWRIGEGVGATDNTFGIRDQSNGHNFLGITSPNIVFNPSNGAINFSIDGDTNDNVFFVDSGNERVGIGTTTPTALLHLYSPVKNINAPTFGTTVGTIMITPNGTNNNYSAITFGANNVNAKVDTASAGIYVDSSSVYGTRMYLATTNSFATGSQSRLIIDENGNVGVNTIIPSNKLTINGTFNATGGSATTLGLLVDSSGNTSIGLGSVPANQKFTVGGNITAGNFGNVSATYFFGDGSKLTNVAIPKIPFQYTATSIYNDTVSANMGLGVVIPSNKLTVNGTFNATGGYDTTIGLIVNGSGAVGIGTDTPAEKLNIVGGNILLDNAKNIKWKNSGGTAFNLITLDGSNQLTLGLASSSLAGTIIQAGTGGSKDIFFKTNSVTQMIITENGQVGIGTAVPSNNLSVVGTFNATGGSATTLGLIVNESGAVGIGTASPNTNLEVYGLNPVLRLADNRNLGDWDYINITGIQFYTNDPSTAGTKEIGAIRIIGNSDSSVLPYGDMAFFITPASPGTTPSEAMRIKYDGSVGIGTTTPTDKLTVVGTFNATNGTIGAAGITLDNLNRIGIGISNPSQNVEIKGPLVFYNGSSTGSVNFSFETILAADTLILNLDSDGTNIGALHIRNKTSTSTTPLLSVNPSGQLAMMSNLMTGPQTLKNYNNFGTAAAGTSDITDVNDVHISDDLEVDGLAYLAGGTAWTQGDIAENIHTKASRNNQFCNGDVSCYKENTQDDLDYGDLVCIDPSEGHTITKCKEANSRLAVGVITNTSVLYVGPFSGYPVSLAGIVWTHVTNENGDIVPGDLLVSSSKLGYAMKNNEPKDGTVIGKAFDFCDRDECDIRIFVALS